MFYKYGKLNIKLIIFLVFLSISLIAGIILLALKSGILDRKYVDKSLDFAYYFKDNKDEYACVVTEETLNKVYKNSNELKGIPKEDGLDIIELIPTSLSETNITKEEKYIINNKVLSSKIGQENFIINELLNNGFTCEVEFQGQMFSEFYFIKEKEKKRVFVNYYEGRRGENIEVVVVDLEEDFEFPNVDDYGKFFNL